MHASAFGVAADPYVGDVVEFDVGLDKQGRQKATTARLIEKDDGDSEIPLPVRFGEAV